MDTYLQTFWNPWKTMYPFKIASAWAAGNLQWKPKEPHFTKQVISYERMNCYKGTRKQ